MTTDTPTPGSSATSFVEGDVATLTATGDQSGGTYEWIGTHDDKVTTGIATVIAGKTPLSHYVFVTYTLNGAVSDPVAVTITEQTLSVTLAATPNPAIVGETVNLIATGNFNGGIYTWTQPPVSNPVVNTVTNPNDFVRLTPSTSSSATLQSGAVGSVRASVTYILRGASATNYVDVSFGGYPVVTLTPPTTSVQVGVNATLTAAGVPTGGTYAFSCADANAIVTTDDAVNGKGTFSSNVQGFYGITVAYVQGGVSVTDTKYVTVTAPTVTLTATPNEVFMGQPSALVATGYPAGGVYTFSCAATQTTITPNPADSSKASFTANEANTYIVAVTYTAYGYSDTKTVEVKVKSVTVTLTVESGATQTNVTGAENWAAVKGTGDVIVKAIVTPTEAAAKLSSNSITWSGGTVGADQFHRKVSKAASAKTPVTATYGSITTPALNVWILWADLEIKTGSNDTIDIGNSAGGRTHTWPGVLGGGSKLGPISKENTTLTYAYAIGKMQAKATLTPVGIETVINKTAWHMKRKKSKIAWDNGGHYNGATWVAGASDSSVNGDDTSDSEWTDLYPSSGTSSRELYDLDGSGCSNVLSGTTINHTSEIYENFTEYVTVTLDADIKCSDDKSWYYSAKIDVDKAAGKVELNSVGTGTITIPTTPAYIKR